MAGPGRHRAALRHLRTHAFPPRYRAGERLTLTTADGVTLAGARLAGPSDAFATVVLVHGLAHSSRTPRIHAFAHALARRVHVVIPDLRGHGASRGQSTLGVDEVLDVDAAVAVADPSLPVVTLGVSLGGAVVLLHAGTRGGVAGVVAVSAPAWSGAWDTAATRRVQRYVTTPAGRRILALALGCRVAPRCPGVPDARSIVASIAPAHLLLVHDPSDHYFGPEHPCSVLEWAGEPKSIWWVEDGGHGTDLLTPDLAERLLDELEDRLGVTR